MEENQGVTSRSIPNRKEVCYDKRHHALHTSRAMLDYPSKVSRLPFAKPEAGKIGVPGNADRKRLATSDMACQFQPDQWPARGYD